MPARLAKIKTMSTFTTCRNWEKSGLFQIFSYLLISSSPSGTHVNVKASPSHLCPPLTLHLTGPFFTSSVRTLNLISIHLLVLLLHHFGTYIVHSQYPLLVLLHNCLSSSYFQYPPQYIYYAHANTFLFICFLWYAVCGLSQSLLFLCLSFPLWTLTFPGQGQPPWFV